jgi:hypothetical protein
VVAGVYAAHPVEAETVGKNQQGGMRPWQDLRHNCQGPVPSIDAPSAGLFLGGFRPRIARFRFTQHPEA